MIEIFSTIAVLGTLFIIVEKIGKVPFLAFSVGGAIIGIILVEQYGVSEFNTGLLILSLFSYFIGGGKIPKL